MKLNGLATLLFLSGCVSGGGGTGTWWDKNHGGEGGNTNTGLAAFVGNSQFATGTVTGACGMAEPSSNPATGSLLVEQSGANEVVTSGSATLCAARFTISGNQGV